MAEKMVMHRENIIFVLHQIALKSVQIDLYNDQLLTTNLPDHLLKKWEAAYRPERPGFVDDFSDQELNQMNCFTDFFLARANRFPALFSELLKDPCWSSVCEYACELLVDFEKR